MSTLGPVGTPVASGSKSPNAELHDNFRAGASNIDPMADLRPMRSTLKRLLSRPLRRLPRSAVAAVADGLSDLAERLERQLRARAVESLHVFELALQDAGERAARRFPDLTEDPEVAFALDDLGPRRIGAAQSALRASDEREYVALIGFLDVAIEGLLYDVDNAEDPPDVADALLRALDSLHDYLIAHRLVGLSYRFAQSEEGGFVFQVGALPHTRSRAQALLFAGSSMPSETWRRHTRRQAQLTPRRFTRDEPKQPVKVA